MLDHHIQRSIIYRLALADDLRFGELKPDDLDNKLFTYHLKKVVGAGLVLKTDDGVYKLTPEGRVLGIRVLESRFNIAERAESVMFLIVRRQQDGSWLLYKRSAHPLKDKVGFMHGIPLATEDLALTAQKLLKKKTDLIGDFITLGGGLFRVYADDSLESFTNFTLLYCDQAQGELSPNDTLAQYEWVLNPDFSSTGMLPNMGTLAKLYSAKRTFFIEKSFTV